MPSHAALALCSPDGFLPGYCEAQVDDEWCVYQGSAWSQPVVMAQSQFDPCTCLIPHNDVGKPISWVWDLTGYTFYLWSVQRDNGVPVIMLDSGGNGIEVNIQYGIVLMSLNPTQTTAIAAGRYTMMFHARRNGTEMTKPLFSATMVVHGPSAYADPAIDPSPLLGVAPTIDAYLIQKAMSCQFLTVFAQPPIITFVNGEGPPTAAVGVPGQHYWDTLTGAHYGPKDPVTGWPAVAYHDPATAPAGVPLGTLFVDGDGPPTAADGVLGQYYIDRVAGAIYGPKAVAGWPGVALMDQDVPESLEETLGVGRTASGDIEFTVPGAGIILRAPNGDRTRITVTDGNALDATDI